MRAQEIIAFRCNSYNVCISRGYLLRDVLHLGIPVDLSLLL